MEGLAELNGKCERFLNALYAAASSATPLVQVWVPLLIQRAQGESVVEMSVSSSPYSIANPRLQPVRELSCREKVMPWSTTSLIARAYLKGTIEIAQDVSKLTESQTLAANKLDVLMKGGVDMAVWIPLYIKDSVRPIGVCEIFICSAFITSLVDVIALATSEMSHAGLSYQSLHNAIIDKAKSSPRQAEAGKEKKINPLSTSKSIQSLQTADVHCASSRQEIQEIGFGAGYSNQASCTSSYPSSSQLAPSCYKSYQKENAAMADTKTMADATMKTCKRISKTSKWPACVRNHKGMTKISSTSPRIGKPLGNVSTKA